MTESADNTSPGTAAQDETAPAAAFDYSDASMIIRRGRSDAGMTDESLAQQVVDAVRPQIEAAASAAAADAAAATDRRRKS